MHRLSVRMLVAGLMLLAVIYHGVGYFYLVSGARFDFIGKSAIGGSDMRIRWQEGQCIWRGCARSLNQGRPVTNFDEDLSDLVFDSGRLHPKVRIPFMGGYPPWAFFLGMPFMWPDWPIVRIVFAAINILATVILCRWSWNFGKQYNRLTAVVSVGATLAMSSFLNILIMGQIGAVVVAAVVGAVQAAERKQHIRSGVFLSVAMVKPTIAFAFLLPFVLRRSWTSLTTMVLVLLVGSAVILAITGCTPSDVLSGLETAGAYSFGKTPSVETVALTVGLQPRRALMALAVAGVVVAWILMCRFARDNWPIQLAIAAVIGRLCTYHRAVDNIMLIFLLTLLAASGFGPRRSRLMTLLFLLLGATLWIPVRANWFVPQVLCYCIWPTILAVALVHLHLQRDRNGALLNAA